MTIRYDQNNTQNVTYKEGLTQITSAALNMMNASMVEIVPNNANMRFLNDNLVNGVMNRLKDLRDISA